MNIRAWAALCSALFLLGCEGGRDLPNSSARTQPTPLPTAAAQPASPSLQACAGNPQAADCALNGLLLSPQDFLNDVQQCTPDEAGLNCVYNAAFDHLFGPQLAQVLNLIVDACGRGEASACAAIDARLPDVLPALSLPVPRGALLRATAPPVPMSRKVVDGDVSDWIGQSSFIGGSQHFSAGEHIYTDYLYDAYGPDDGTDERRIALLGPLIEAQARFRRIDQLVLTLGDQLGVPAPLGTTGHYGDGENGDATDLHEVRWAVQGSRLHLLVTLSKLADPARVHLVVRVDQDADGVAEREIHLRPEGVSAIDLASGAEVAVGGVLAINPENWINAVEAAFDLSALQAVDDSLRLSLHSRDTAGVPANIAYRLDEPVAGLYNDQNQALALRAGDLDRFLLRIDLAALREGANETVQPGPGYHERQFFSGDNIAFESGENARLQRYGLYIPSRYDQTPTAISYWLHYRGGKAHSGAAITPRLIDELGEKPGHIVATPHGRGTSSWYTTDAHQDVFEVMADVEALLAVDTERRYLSGYSMGGYGTYLFGLLYPDLWAAGYSTAGAPTQGGWTGLGPDLELCNGAEFPIPGLGEGNACFVQANDGDANAQLNFRILENARHLPLSIHHGFADNLVPYTSITRFGARLFELGYRFDFLSFVGFEHFAQAAFDEWAEGARYMHSFVRTAHPRQISYKIVPALVHAVNTVKPDPADATFDFRPDGAWWVDELVVAGVDPENPRDTSVFGLIEAESRALPAQQHLSVPRSGLVHFGDAETTLNLGTPVVADGHSNPFIRQGLDWVPLQDAPLENRFAATLTQLSAATLDVAGMGLDLSAGAEGEIITDTALTLRFANLPPEAQVRAGETMATRDSRRRAVLELAPGTHQIRLEGAP